MAAITERSAPSETIGKRRTGGVVGAASGAAFVALVLAGNSLAEEGGNATFGMALGLLGFVALACFVAYSATLRPGRWAGNLALVGGITTVAVKLGSAAPYLAAEHGDASPEVAAGLVAINDWAFTVSWLPHGLFVIGLALAALQAALLPRTVSWIGVVIGVGCVAAVVVATAASFVVPFLLSLLWIVVASALLVRRELRGPVERQAA